MPLLSRGPSHREAPSPDCYFAMSFNLFYLLINFFFKHRRLRLCCRKPRVRNVSLTSPWVCHETYLGCAGMLGLPIPSCKVKRSQVILSSISPLQQQSTGYPQVPAVLSPRASSTHRSQSHGNCLYLYCMWVFACG